MIDKLKALFKDRESLREPLTYLLFGVLTTLVNWVVYFLLTAWLRPDSYPTASAARAWILNGSQITAWLVSVVFAYLTNRRYVFQSKVRGGAAVREFFLFVSARVSSYLLFDLLLFNLCVFALGLNHSLTKLLMNVLVVIFNYFASKFVIFRKESKSGSQQPDGQ